MQHDASVRQRTAQFTIADLSHSILYLKDLESANASVLLSRLLIELMPYKNIQNVFQITKNVGTIYNFAALICLGKPLRYDHISSIDSLEGGSSTLHSQTYIFSLA